MIVDLPYLNYYFSVMISGVDFSEKKCLGPGFGATKKKSRLVLRKKNIPAQSTVDMFYRSCPSEVEKKKSASKRNKQSFWL